MSTLPKYDPDELEAAGLTEEEAEGVRQGLLQIDRGETVDGKVSFARLRGVLEQMTRLRERRSA
jgi:hypothetical protein